MPSNVVPTLPTASGLDRAMHCAGSMCLPRVQTEGGKAAQRGSTLHKYVEEARTIGKSAALANISDDDWRNQANAIDLDALPVGAESEIALAYCPETGHAVRLELKGAREYPDMPGYLMGTGDLVGVGEDYVAVLDIKTGQAVVSAEASWQLRFLALAAAVLSEKRKAKVALCYLRDDGSWRMDWAEFSAADLGGFANDLRLMMGRAEAAAEDVNAGRVPPLATGPWCRWCRSVQFCEAQVGLVRALVPTLGDINGTLASMTAEQRGVAYTKFKAAEELVKKIGSAFSLIAETEPIQLGGGLVVKRVMSSRSVAAPGAAKYIAENFNLETLLGASTVDLKGLSQQIRASLEANGLVTTTRFPQLRQVKEKVR